MTPFHKKILSTLMMSFILCAINAPSAAFATERGEVRKDSRSTRQTGRNDAQEEKKECREADEKSNAACRKQKRGSKQESREDARDIKY